MGTSVAEKSSKGGFFKVKQGQSLGRYGAGVWVAKPPGRWKFFRKCWQKHQKMWISTYFWRQKLSFCEQKIINVCEFFKILIIFCKNPIFHVRFFIYFYNFSYFSSWFCPFHIIFPLLPKFSQNFPSPTPTMATLVKRRTR